MESESSKKAAKKGVRLAKKDHAKVIGVHVLDVDELNTMDVGSGRLAQLEKKQKAKGESALQYLEVMLVCLLAYRLSIMCIVLFISV